MMNVIGASVGGWAGWWVGDHRNLTWALLLSLIGSVAGMIVGRRLLARYLDD